MGEVQRVVSNLIQMLDSELEQYKSYAEDMHKLQSCLEEKLRELDEQRLAAYKKSHES